MRSITPGLPRRAASPGGGERRGVGVVPATTAYYSTLGGASFSSSWSSGQQQQQSPSPQQMRSSPTNTNNSGGTFPPEQQHRTSSNDESLSQSTVVGAGIIHHDQHDAYHDQNEDDNYNEDDTRNTVLVTPPRREDDRTSGTFTSSSNRIPSYSQGRPSSVVASSRPWQMQEHHQHQYNYQQHQRSSTVHNQNQHHSSWDSDAAFPIKEIERIKSKTKKLRNARGGEQFIPAGNDPDHIFREGRDFGDGDEDNHINNNHNNSNDDDRMHHGGSVRHVRSVKNGRTWSSGDFTSNAGDGGGLSAASGNIKDSLVDAVDNNNSKAKQPQAPMSDDTPNNPFAARVAVQEVINAFHRTGRQRPNPKQQQGADSVLNTSDPLTEGTNESTDSPVDDKDLALHDLCGEAIATDDVAWRNALYLLSVNPLLANIADGGWTPLHICCLGSAPPPSFMVRALLYCNPYAVRQPDQGGRLPLHLVAASSADVDTMQLLVDEYPPALCHTDDHGLIPLHLLLRNLSVPLTTSRTRVLLGLTVGQDSEGAEDGHHTDNRRKSRWKHQNHHHILLRRREHLHLGLEELRAWMNHPPPVTDFNRDASHERNFDSYPNDVRQSLRKVAHWKHRQRHAQAKDHNMEHDAIEVELAPFGPSEMNPAAMIAPGSMQLPIHMLIRRAIVDKSPLKRPTNTRRTGPLPLVRPPSMTAQSPTPATSSKNPFDDESLPTQSRRCNPFDEEDPPEERRPAPAHSSSLRDNEDDVDEDTTDSDIDVKSLDNQTSVVSTLEQVRVCAACYPEGLVSPDGHGLTPLLTVMQVKDTVPGLELVEVLLGKRLLGYNDSVMPSWANDIPLEQIRNAGLETINPAMVPRGDTGQLPLHVAAEELLSDFDILHSIYESYPGAVHVQDARGRTPLHVSLRSYREFPTDPRTIALLFADDRVARVRDDKGMLPFDVLLESAESIPRTEPPEQQGLDTLRRDVKSVYQRLFRVSILGPARPASRSASSQLLTRLRALPLWLRKECCSVSYVQDLVIDDISSPQVCALIILDGVLLMAMVTVFRLQMKDFAGQVARGGRISSWYTYAVYATGSCRLLMIASFSMLGLSFEEFRSMILLDGWRLIDIVAMILSLLTSAFLYGGTEEEVLFSMGAASTGLLWLAIIGYLSNWWHGMAIFTGGLVKVGSWLAWPSLAAGALLVSVAQMFYTLQQVGCVYGPPAAACTVRDSYRVVYLLLRGSPFGSLDTTTTAKLLPPETIAMLAISLFFLVAFTIAVVVTIILATLRLDAEQLALTVFWEPKLSVVLAMRELRLIDRGNSRESSFARALSSSWNAFMMAMFGSRLRDDKLWYAKPNSSRVRVAFLTLSAIVVIPVWTIVGFFSLGILWPNELRRWLFRPMAINNKSQHTTEEFTKLGPIMREEINQLKVMAYEKSGQLEQELRLIKELLYQAMKE